MARRVAASRPSASTADRESGVEGKSVDLGGCRIIKKKKNTSRNVQAGRREKHRHGMNRGDRSMGDDSEARPGSESCVWGRWSLAVFPGEGDGSSPATP